MLMFYRCMRNVKGFHYGARLVNMQFAFTTFITVSLKCFVNLVGMHVQMEAKRFKCALCNFVVMMKMVEALAVEFY